MGTRTVYLQEVALEEAEKRLRQALQLVGRWGPLEAEELPLEEALGRVTAAPVWARLSSPHYHACAMDGYALRAADTHGASDTHPLRLKLGTQAIPVDTGDPLPPWADAVVMIEYVVEKEGAILLRAPLARWQNVRSVGEDIVATELLLPANQRLRPVDLGAIAGAGLTTVQVYRRPRVVVIPTGDELVTPGTKPRPGDIIEYNSLILAAQVRAWGGEALRQPIVRDDPLAIAQAVTEATAHADLVLINAGSSAGRDDYTARIIAELGQLLVHGINVRPGHPVVMGLVADVPIIGVPGYPVSAALTGEIFVRPLLYRWQGQPVPTRTTVPATITRTLLSPAGDDEFVRVVVGKVGERTLAVPLSRGAGVLTSLVRADGLMVIPRFSEGVNAGDRVKVRLYRSPEEIERTLLAMGSHDMTLDLIAQFLAEHAPPQRLVSANVGSLGGLHALRRGEAHLAGSHLLDPESGTYNVPYVRRYLPDMPVVLITLAHREQGLILRHGNPKGITSVQDLLREDVVYVNRQRGAGTRVLLDYLLSQAGISATQIAGYDREEVTHLAVAVDVATGLADCGLGVRAAAVALGLDFVTVAWERYDLVIPQAFWNTPLLTPLHDLLADGRFRDAVGTLPGYDPSEMGRLVSQE